MLQTIKGVKKVRAAKPWPIRRPPRHPPPPRPGRRGAFRPNAPGKMQIERRVSLFRFRNFLYKFYKQVQVKGAFPCPPAAPASAERGDGWETQGLADVCAQLPTMAVVVPFSYHSPLGGLTAPRCALRAGSGVAVVLVQCCLPHTGPFAGPELVVAVWAQER